MYHDANVDRTCHRLEASGSIVHGASAGSQRSRYLVGILHLCVIGAKYHLRVRLNC